MADVILFLLPSLVSCALLVGILGYLGMHVLEREIIFIDIALAQCATVGYAVAVLILGHEAVEEGSAATVMLAFGSSVGAAAFFSYMGIKIRQISQETVIGVSYAIAAAATLFLLALAAGADVHLDEMLSGSLLWVQWPRIIYSAVLFSMVGGFHIVFRKRFIALSRSHAASSREERKRNFWWDFLFYASMALVITQSVQIAGLLVTFGLLVIPTTLSALFSGSYSVRLAITWLVGMFSGMAGLLLSYYLDYSSGPSIVFMLGLVLVVAAVFMKIFGSSKRGYKGTLRPVSLGKAPERNSRNRQEYGT